MTITARTQGFFWGHAPMGLVVASMAVVAIGLGACSRQASEVTAPRAGRVDAARLANAVNEPDQWLASGRDAGGTYFSPLKDINVDNVKQLGSV